MFPLFKFSNHSENSQNSQKYNLYFGIFVICHMLIWTLLPYLTRSNMHLDTLEAIIWGQEWQLGYQKHPPLSAWFAEIIMNIFHHKIWASYFLSQICIATSLIIMWLLARLFLTPIFALMSVLILEGIYYYNFTSTEFNTNILLLALWSLSIFYFWKALSANKIHQWLILGALLGLLMLTKYFALMLICSMSILMIYEKKFRDYLKTPGPYLTAIIFLLVISPHLLWLIDNDFPTINYMISRSKTEYHFYNHLLNPLSFIAAQLFSILFALLIFFVAFGFKIKINRQITDEKSSFLILMFFGPLFFTILPSLLTASQVKDMWGTPLWGLCGIMLFYFFDPKLSKTALKKFLITWILVIIIAAISYSASNLIYMIKPQKRNSFNGQMAADLVTEKWHQFNQNNLPIIVGDIWLSSNISFFSKDHPRAFIDMDIKTAPWISYETLENQGGIIVWDIKEEGADLPKRYQNKINSKILIKEPLLISSNHKKYQNQKPFELGLAIVLPIPK